MVTQTAIAAALTDLGLSAGDTVLLHSSLSSFGHVEGGAPTVVAALLEVVTPSGTLIAPTFSRYLLDEPVWDRENTPSLMGKISETIRTWPGALRSNHAGHPYAAIGAQAETICRRPYRTGFGVDTPLQTLVDENAWILLMGVPYHNCTLFHLFEAASNLPYWELEERKGTIIIDGVRDENGSAWEYRRAEGLSNDFIPLGLELESRGLVSRCTVGNSEQRLFRAREAYEVGMAILRDNPLFLLSAESQARWLERQ